MNEIVLPAVGSPKHLIFLFHGYGANKEGMQFLGEAFSKAMPSAEVHIPDGFSLDEKEEERRAWFPMLCEDSDGLGDELHVVQPHIVRYIDEVKGNYNLEYSDVILSGFSQGAMLSLSFGIFLNVKAVISFAGALLKPSDFLRKCDTKVLIAHGESDNVVPLEEAKSTERILKQAGVDVQMITSKNLFHAVDERLLNGAVDFLTRL